MATSVFANSLAGKVAFVTGAGGDIGGAIAIRCATEGARVAVADIDADGGAAIVAAIEDAGGEAVFVECDISSEEAVAAAVAATVDCFGRLDVLVNCAAAFVFGDVEETTVEMWNKVLQVNVIGTALCTKYAVAEMKRQGEGGAVVNIASISSWIGQPGFVPYSTTKGAILQMTRNLAVDLAPDNIRVNAVCPGTIETKATLAKKTKDELETEMANQVLIKRLGSTDEVANCVVFLASPLASFVTGTHLLVDGGYTCL